MAARRKETRRTVGLETWELIVVAVAALLTSILTAVAGLGGGMVLLVVLLQFLDPVVAVPVHGVIQLCSNSSRAVLLARHIERRFLGPYAVLLLPGAVVGLGLANLLPRVAGRALIGAFALVVTWRPGLLQRTTAEVTARRFVPLGAAAGVLNPTIGAPGPFLAPWFRAVLPGREAFVATFAAAQVLGHLAKVVVFAVAGVAWSDHLPVIVLGVAGVVAGSFVGTRLLGKLDEARFQHIFRIAITVVSLRLLVDAVAALVT